MESSTVSMFVYMYVAFILRFIASGKSSNDAVWCEFWDINSIELPE